MNSDGARVVALAGLAVVAALIPTAGAVAAAQDATITVDHDGETVTVANGTSQVISGTADLPVGTELLVRLRSTGETDPQFIRSESAVVTENGTWAVALDFDVGGPGPGFTEGETFSLTVTTEDGEHSTELDGEFVACGGDCADPTPARTPTPRPEQTPTPTPTAGTSPSVSLSESAVAVDRADVAVLELAFDGADVATVSVGSEAAGYRLNVTVRDADGDGRAGLYLDTALAGREGRTVSATEGDSVSVRSETALSATLDAGEYDVTVYPGESATGTPVEVATLFVQEEDDGGDATTPASTPTEQPTDGGGSGSLTTLVVSGVFLLGGAVVAFVVLR